MAKTVVDELVTLFGLKLTPGTTKIINSFTGALNNISKKAMLMGAAIDSAAALLVGFSGKTAHAVANNARLAKAMKVNVETLQEFQFAAKVTGASADDITSAFQSLTRAMNPTRPGQYSTQLVLIGQKIKDVLGDTKDAAAVFLELSKATRYMTDQQRLNIFGELGFSPSLITLINKGQDAIVKLLIEARKVGAVVTEKDIKRIITLDESFSRVKSTLDGLKIKTLVNLSPILNKIVKSTQAWAIANVSVFGSLSNILLSGVFEGFKLLSTAILSISTSINKISPTKFTNISTILKYLIAGTTVAGIGLLSLKMASLIAKISGLTLVLKILRTALIAIAVLIGIDGTLVLGVAALVAGLTAAFALLGKIGKLKNLSKLGSTTKGNKALGLGATPDTFLSNKLPGNPFKNLLNFKALGTGGSISGIGSTDNSKTNNSNITHNTTINVNGSQDPKSTASEIKSIFGGSLSLNESAKLTNPGFNRPSIA